jgi:hypothetical protein
MCDFRKIIGVVIDGKQIDINTTSGHFYSFPMAKDTAPGLYHVGASGCGLYYCDGKSWYTDYDGHHAQCKFIVEENTNVPFH